MATSSDPGTLGGGGGGEDYEDYYDIMLLGKTGMGKTTTADKLLLANPTHANYEYDPSVVDSATTRNTVPNGTGIQQNGHSAASQTPDLDLSEGAPTDSMSTIKSSTQYNDLSMWHLSQDQDLEEVTRRLKDLVMWRCLESPHKQVNENRKKSISSVSCELLSNDTSKIRVLDVPGFYGPNSAQNVNEKSPNSVYGRVEAGIENDLTVMRKILHIKVATQFKFNRIVYFLPDSGVLTRPSQTLQTEIRIMERYFKRTVFDCMVIVATHNHSIYSRVREDCDLYTPEELEQTRDVLQQAMQKVFITGDVPNPPIIFVSQFDSCDEVLRKIKESKVVREGVGLSFNPSICARCGIHIGKLANPENAKDSEMRDEIAICTNTPGSTSVAIPYDETLCHPIFVPKYHAIQCILGGIVHVITWKKFMGNWPYFGNEDEVCICCKSSPKSKGCTRVGTKYKHKKSKGEGIDVNHTSRVEENYKFVMDPTDPVMRLKYADTGEEDKDEIVDDEKVDDYPES